MQRTEDDILCFRIETLICILLVNISTHAIYRDLLPYVSPKPGTCLYLCIILENKNGLIVTMKFVAKNK